MATQIRAESSPVHARTFLAGSVFSAASMVIGGVLTLVTGILFARWLKPDGFGVYSLALVTMSFLAGCGTAGMDAMVARFAAYYLGTGEKHNIRRVIRYAIRWALLISTVLGAAALAVMQVKGTALSRSGAVAWYVAAAVPLLALQLVIQQALSGLQSVYTRVVLEKIVQPALRLGLPIVLLLWVHDSLQAATAALTITALVVSAVAGFALLQNLRTLPARMADANASREWSRYALPFAFYALQNFVYAGMGIDILLVGALASVEQSGIYAAAFRFAPVLLLARGAMEYAFGPKIGVLYGASDFQAIADLYKMSSAISLSWTLPVAIVLAVFGRPLMAGLFGPGYADGGTVLAILVLGCAVDGATGCNTTLLSVIGKPWLVLLNGLVSGAATIVLCVFLIPHYGMLAAAFAVTMARTIANAMTTIQIWYLQRLQPFDGSTLKIIGAGAAAATLGIIFRAQLSAGGFPMLLPAIALIFCSYLLVLRLTGLQWSPR